jgi:hypothetical protein
LKKITEADSDFKKIMDKLIDFWAVKAIEHTDALDRAWNKHEKRIAGK